MDPNTDVDEVLGCFIKADDDDDNDDRDDKRGHQAETNKQERDSRVRHSIRNSMIQRGER